jgi:hypothetical protein
MILAGVGNHTCNYRTNLMLVGHGISSVYIAASHDDMSLSGKEQSRHMVLEFSQRLSSHFPSKDGLHYELEFDS